MKISSSPISLTKASTELIAVNASEESYSKFLKGKASTSSPLQQINSITKGAFLAISSKKMEKPKKGSSFTVEFPTEKKFKGVLVYVGTPEDESVRKFAASIVQASKSLKLYSCVAISEDINLVHYSDSLLEGLELSSYKFNKWKSAPDKSPQLKEVTIASQDKLSAKTISKIRTIIDGVTLARDLGNLPANECFPTTIAETAREIGREHGLEVTTWNKKQLQKLGANAILAVAKGSSEEAYLIRLKYTPANSSSKRNIAIIGKGVTYDTGGYSLKPAGSMDGMKFDMCGAAAVLGAMKVIAQLKPSVEITAYIPTCENMINGEATRVGDIITTLNGKTVEILNTDAEGRLILADAFAQAVKDNATEIIDLATLTGGVIVALGTYCAGLFSNNDALAQKLLETSNEAGEKLWRLPLIEEHRDDIKSSIADLKNIASHRWSQAIIGALFLEEFAGNLPWAHLDIAGVADSDKAIGYTPKGATGFGVRTLVKYLLSIGSN